MLWSQRAFYTGVEWGIRAGVPGSIGGSAYAGYAAGEWAADNCETMSLEIGRVTPDESLRLLVVNRARARWFEKLLPLMARNSRSERDTLKKELDDGLEVLRLKAVAFRPHAVEEGGPFLFFDSGDDR